MSKVDELKKKYPSIRQGTFDKFKDADKTPTKKYLEYFLKIWSDRVNTQCPSNSSALITLIDKFDSLLLYIENKDIYSSKYRTFTELKNVVETAELVRDEKTFKKEDHVIIIKESENYLIVQPKTHRGSCQYGSGTKWCTASKHSPEVFKSYNNDGLLFYVIRKSNLENQDYNKIALYMIFGEDQFKGNLDIYNAKDVLVSTDRLILNKFNKKSHKSLVCGMNCCYKEI